MIDGNTGREDPRFAVGMLRVVMALRRQPDATIESIVDRIIDETGLEATGFRAHVARHTPVIAGTAQRQEET